MFTDLLSPVFFYHSGSAETYGVFRNLAIDERLRADNGVIVDPRSFQHRTLSCDPNIIADGYPLRGESIGCSRISRPLAMPWLESMI